MAITGCSSGGDDESAPATTTTVAARVPEATFERGPCEVERVPEDRVDCGTLVHDGVRLPVAIVRATAPNPASDPIVYFSGGPGFPALEDSHAFVELELDPTRDVIVFDQRGTGGAEPSLDCPENESAVYEVLGGAEPAAEELAVTLAALGRCRERLVGSGADLDAFDTPTTAADVEALRVALDIDEWNIFGVSYGTTVALEVLRQHPETVRSAVIDSVFPPDVTNAPRRSMENAERVFDVLFDGCAADAACAARFPDLEGQFDAAWRSWNEDPFEQTVDGHDLVLTGDDLVAGLWNAMYDSALIGIIPQAVEWALDRADSAALLVDEFARSGIGQLIGSAEGVAVGVNCADRIGLGGDEPLADAEADHPRLRGLLYLGANAFGASCDLWDVEPVDGDFNVVGETDVPTLVLGNDYDPVTPPADGQRTASALGPRATFVRFPSLGHGAVFAHDCPRTIMRSFLASPSGSVDPSCAATIPPPTWAGVSP